MKIQRIPSDLLRSNMYVIEDNGHAIIIDPCSKIEYGRGLIVDRILLTHEHYDHISGVNKWKSKFKADVVCSYQCSKRITNAKKNLSRYFNDFCDIQSWINNVWIPEIDEDYSCNSDICFMDDMEFDWEGHTIRIFALPGHSKGSSGILIDEYYFFSGDSVMKDFDIELKLPGGSRLDWENISKKKIQNLPNEIHVYPGHFEDFDLKRG